MATETLRTLPFKDQLQDKWKFICYALLLAAITSVAWRSNFDTSAAEGILIGGVFGVLGHYKATRVTELSVSAEIVNLDDIHDAILIRKYISIVKYIKYEPNIHRLLRFDAQNILVNSTPCHYLITGPRYIIMKIQNDFHVAKA